MRSTALAAVSVATFALAACATSYQSKGFTGGYSDTQLGPDIFRVEFQGNGFTSRERASDFLMLRCAQLTLEHGYQDFVFLNDKNEGGYSTVGGYASTTYGPGGSSTYFVPPESVYKPGEAVMIKMLHTPPKNARYVLNARDVYDSISTKYHLTLPPE